MPNNGMAITWGDIELRLEWINKKDAFAFVSLACLCFLLGVVINDFYQVAVMEETLKTSQKYSMALLVLHAMSFYFALLSFIYTTQSYTTGSSLTTKKHVALTLFATLGNFAAFIMRITFDVTFCNYREEFYRLATESGK